MLEQKLKKLADPAQPLTRKQLRALSALDTTDIAKFRQSWPAIAEARRRQIVHAMIESAEDDPEADFVDVFRVLMTDSDAEVRATAVSGLWDADDKSLIDVLIKMLSTDPSALVRAAVAEVLSLFGNLVADQPKRAQRVTDALLAAYHNTNDPATSDAVRRSALESAASFSEDERVNAAIRDAYNSASPTLRAGAVGAMGSMFDEQWTAIILQELESTEPEMRFVAARSASELTLEAAVPRLVKLTADRDPEVQNMAIWALSEIGGLQAKATLTQLLESHNEGVRDAAEEAIENLHFNENPLDFADLLAAPNTGAGKKRKDK